MTAACGGCGGPAPTTRSTWRRKPSLPGPTVADAGVRTPGTLARVPNQPKTPARAVRVPDAEWEAAMAAAATMPPDEDGRPETVSRAIRGFLRLYTDPLWREARHVADARGESVWAVLREALARYVRRHEKTKGTDRG